MSNIAIRVENLGKLYRIGRRESYRTLRDSITGAVAAPFRRLRSSQSTDGNGGSDSIWALKDLSFDLKRGEVIGVIGRNGAGKSTLLKVLSRITEPTEGHAEIHGRVGSLLEVGTGFHPELTGRENIYLNGAILGMKRAEINRKFDEIVAFAEVEKFLDTPVKHYSSGMYVRLAFAVAAHLEPEILIVDEVLAVGDLAFQKKCLGNMDDAAKSGRTIIFVTHQMNQIRRLCSQCLWLNAGKVRQVGETGGVVAAYETAMGSTTIQQSRDSRPAQHAAFLQWEIIEPVHRVPSFVETTGSLTVRFLLNASRSIRRAHHGIGLYNNERQLMWGTDAAGLDLAPGIHEFVYQLSILPLKPGNYFWRVSLYDETGRLDDWDCLPELTVATLPSSHSRDEWAGILNIPYKFAVRAYDNTSRELATSDR